MTADETAATIESLAPKAKPAKKAPKAKASSNGKATKKAPAKKTEGDRGPTARERTFRLLAKTGGMTGPAIKEKLALSGVPSFLKDELFGAKPRIRRTTEEGTRGVIYQLTAAGKADLEKGTVDANAPESSAGKDIPSNR
jgi:hypothetical protein